MQSLDVPLLSGRLLQVLRRVHWMAFPCVALAPATRNFLIFYPALCWGLCRSELYTPLPGACNRVELCERTPGIPGNQKPTRPSLSAGLFGLTVKNPL